MTTQSDITYQKSGHILHNKLSEYNSFGLRSIILMQPNWFNQLCWSKNIQKRNHKRPHKIHNSGQSYLMWNSHM